MTAKKVVPSIFSILAFILIWFLFRPAINVRNGGMVVIFTICFLIGFVVSLFFYWYDDEFDGTNIIFLILTLLFLLIFLIGEFIVGGPLFNATKLQERLEIEEKKNFEAVVKDIDINNVPRIDNSVAKKLANRKLGELVDVVSQYEVDTAHSTLINYKGKPYRVLPLKYADDSFFKYLANKETGIPGYILVDLIDQKAEYVQLEKGINYSPSAYCSKDLNKRIKSKYPASILGEFNFEIDEKGNPYWVVSEITPKSGLDGVKTIKNIIIVNAISGKVERCPLDDVPKWIDRALDTDVVLDEINSWGKFQKGFWNSIIGQKQVKVTTDLYNFIIQDDDVYLYTGITSANGSDQSNIGFCLVNMRTGSSRYVPCPSVNEKSAKDSAKTIYQEKKYKATDPLLLNINDEPTYFTSLKDDAGLVKVYVLVNAIEYKIVGYASEEEGIEKAIENYKLALEGKTFETNEEPSKEDEEKKVVKLEKIDVEVEDIKEITINGTTSYYILSNDMIVVAPITAGMKELPLLKIGSKISVNAEAKDDYYLVHSIEKDE